MSVSCPTVRFDVQRKKEPRVLTMTFIEQCRLCSDSVGKACNFSFGPLSNGPLIYKKKHTIPDLVLVGEPREARYQITCY